MPMADVPAARYKSLAAETAHGRDAMRGRRWMGAAGALLALAVTAHAEDAVFPAGGILEALKARVGKAVTLHLASGTAISGNVGEVRDHEVVIKGLSGREFSDALVRIDVIEAVEARSR
jgi:hypothetical protein